MMRHQHIDILTLSYKGKHGQFYVHNNLFNYVILNIIEWIYKNVKIRYYIISKLSYGDFY